MSMVLVDQVAAGIDILFDVLHQVLDSALHAFARLRCESGILNEVKLLSGNRCKQNQPGSCSEVTPTSNEPIMSAI